MKANIFEYREYKTYLMDWVQAKGHGSKKLIAKYTETQTAYVSQVLNGNAHLSAEQCIRLRGVFEFSQQEAEFFILLNHLERAGTGELRQVFERQVNSIVELRNLVKARIGSEVRMDSESQAKYFSTWHFAAIHTALLIPELRTIKNLSARFHQNVPPSFILLYQRSVSDATLF